MPDDKAEEVMRFEIVIDSCIFNVTKINAVRKPINLKI